MHKLIMILKCMWLVFLLNVISANQEQTASVVWNENTGKFTIQDRFVSNSVVNATFTDEIFQTGWSFLEIKSSEIFPDPVQAYAAGLVEGFLTADLLKKHWYNVAGDYCDGEEAYCMRLKDFLQKNLNYVNAMIKAKRQHDIYWHQIALTLEQLNGLEDAYKNVTNQPRTKIDAMGLVLLNVMGDLEDLEAVLKKQTQRTFGHGSCSALVKVLPNNKDLYFAHDSWTGYNTMLRILKKYNLNFHTGMNKGSPVVPGHTVTFSSQPGTIFSGDDFYLISSGLVTVETTIGNSNNSLWKYITPEGTILEWQRNIVANRLAENGEQWANLFGILNSGTYNNQWMIVDYKKFQSGKPLQDGLLWILEQLPGYLHMGDETDTLRKQSYWPSYNVPFYKDIFKLSGSEEKAEKYGDWFTYDKTPRALIFKRDQIKVHDLQSMIKLMRYNDFKNDPLSRCNCTPPYSAENAIAARCDLNPADGKYPIAALGHRSHGATDMKLTTSTLFPKFEFIAFGGPTYDSLPAFQWSISDFDKTVRHKGQPDLWKFKPIVHKWN